MTEYEKLSLALLASIARGISYVAVAQPAAGPGGDFALRNDIRKWVETTNAVLDDYHRRVPDSR